jgi:hypothetical protein
MVEVRSSDRLGVSSTALVVPRFDDLTASVFKPPLVAFRVQGSATVRLVANVMAYASADDQVRARDA